MRAPARSGPRLRLPSPSALALTALLALAFPVLLHVGRDQWFFLDEWAFLVDRDLRDPASMVRPHNGHWVTVPAVVFRLVFRVWGIASYRPYQVAGIVAHGAVVVAVWHVMRRMGVRGGIATITVVPLLLLGSGRDNIVSAFQITMTAALALGLCHLLLADHDGPWSRRDLLGLACGFVALQCSGVAVPLVVGVAVSVWLRRGLRAASGHAGPLAVAYAVWLVTMPGDHVTEVHLGAESWRFAAEIIGGSLWGLVRHPLVAAALGTVVVATTAVLGRDAVRSRDRAPVAVPAGLAVGCGGFVVSVGLARSFSGDPDAGRYVYTTAAMLLPFVALAAERLVVRARAETAGPVARFAPVFVLGLLAVGMPGNLDLLGTQSPTGPGRHAQIVALERSDHLATADGSGRFSRSQFRHLGPTVSWLRQTIAAGRGPAPTHVPRRMQLVADLFLITTQSTDSQEGSGCRAAPSRIRLGPGDAVHFTGRVELVLVADDGLSAPYVFDAAAGPWLRVSIPVEVQARAVGGGVVRLC